MIEIIITVCIIVAIVNANRTNALDKEYHVATKTGDFTEYNRKARLWGLTEI